MKIANADKLKKHFESVVDVKLFTVPNILTIIDTFSVEVQEGRVYKFTQDGNDIIVHDLTAKQALDPCDMNLFEPEKHIGGTEP